MALAIPASRGGSVLASRSSDVGGMSGGAGGAGLFSVSLTCSAHLALGFKNNCNCDFCNVLFFRDGVVSPVPNPQHGGPVNAPSLASHLSTCLAWVSLPGDEYPASIALEVSETRKPPNRRQGVTLWEGSMISPMLINYDSFVRGRRNEKKV